MKPITDKQRLDWLNRKGPYGWRTVEPAWPQGWNAGFDGEMELRINIRAAIDAAIRAESKRRRTK